MPPRWIGVSTRGLLLATCALLGIPSGGCGGGSSGEVPTRCTLLPGTNPAKPSSDRQVSLEVRFVAIQQSFLGQLGFDFDVRCPVNAGPPDSDEGTNGHGEPLIVDAAAMGGAAGIPTLLPAVPPQDALLPTFFPLAQQPVSAFSLFLTLPGPDCVEFAPAFRQAVQGSVPTLPSPLPSGSAPQGLELAAEVLTPTQLADFLAHIGQEPLNRVIDAPTATLYEGQILHLLLRNQIASLAELEPQYAAAAAPLSPPQDLVIVGPFLRLLTRLVPGSDEIRLRIFPDAPALIVLPPVPLTAGGSPGGAEVPVHGRSGARTEIRVADGGTVLLGGIVQAPSTEVQLGLPTFRKLPVIGTLFRSPTQIQDSAELMILVTPRIIVKPD